jgi:DNA topoisomerase-1
MKAVAERLGNTPTVCRKCYIHPAVLEQYYSGAMLQAIETEVADQMDRQRKELREEEFALLRLLSYKPRAA